MVTQPQGIFHYLIVVSSQHAKEVGDVYISEVLREVPEVLKMKLRDRCLSVPEGVHYMHHGIGHIVGYPQTSDLGTYPPMLTSGGDHWRPDQTCSLEDLHPTSTGGRHCICSYSFHSLWWGHLYPCFKLFCDVM